MIKGSFIKWALTLLGVSAASCDTDSLGGGKRFRGEEIIAMYGVPYAEFTIKGTVSDEEKNPLEGIVVTHYSDSLASTASDGTYKANFREFSKSNVDTVVLNFHDRDGEKNGGQFIDASIVVDVKEGKYNDTTGWKTGDYSASAANVTMAKMEK